MRNRCRILELRCIRSRWSAEAPRSRCGVFVSMCRTWGAGSEVQNLNLRLVCRSLGSKDAGEFRFHVLVARETSLCRFLVPRPRCFKPVLFKPPPLIIQSLLPTLSATKMGTTMHVDHFWPLQTQGARHGGENCRAMPGHQIIRAHHHDTAGTYPI